MLPAESDTSWLDDYARLCRSELHVDARVLVCHGDPCRRLIELAKTYWADVIVVGQTCSVGHRLIGAVGRRIERRAGVPVTAVP